MFIRLKPTECTQRLREFAEENNIDIDNDQETLVYEANVGYYIQKRISIIPDMWRCIDYFVGDPKDYEDRDWHVPLYLNVSPYPDPDNSAADVVFAYDNPVDDDKLRNVPIVYSRDYVFTLMRDLFHERYPTACNLSDAECSRGLQNVILRLSQPLFNCKNLVDAFNDMLNGNIYPFLEELGKRKGAYVVWLN